MACSTTPSARSAAPDAHRPGRPSRLGGRTVARIGYGAMQLELCLAEGIAWVPFFPLGGAFATMPKVTDQPTVRAAALSLGCTPSQFGLAWLLHHAPNVLLVPGTASTDHLDANLVAGMITLADATLATLADGSRTWSTVTPRHDRPPTSVSAGRGPVVHHLTRR